MLLNGFLSKTARNVFSSVIIVAARGLEFNNANSPNPEPAPSFDTHTKYDIYILNDKEILFLDLKKKLDQNKSESLHYMFYFV